jgi:hypothetical protein
MYVFGMGLILLMLVAGCGAGQNYGKSVAASMGPDPMTIETLIENWQDYHIYYTGLSEQQPTGVAFDMKNDDKILDCSAWTKIEDKKTLTYVLGMMKTFMTGAQKLFKILGPDDQLYGYVYTPLDGARTKVTAPNTLHVSPIGVGG